MFGFVAADSVELPSPTKWNILKTKQLWWLGNLNPNEDSYVKSKVCTVNIKNIIQMPPN